MSTLWTGTHGSVEVCLVLRETGGYRLGCKPYVCLVRQSTCDDVNGVRHLHGDGTV